MCINGHWADICSSGSSSLPTTIARAFCRKHTGLQSCKQLRNGLNRIYKSTLCFNDTLILIVVSFGTQSCCSQIIRRNTGDLTLYSITCNGQSGNFLQDCSPHGTISSGSYTATSGSCNLQSEMIVGCYESANCNAGDVRLIDGNRSSEGRVEFCNQGLWGAITTSSWGSSDAKVVCRQLGFPWECE